LTIIANKSKEEKGSKKAVLVIMSNSTDEVN
jgi:hypothetical protein